MYAYKLSKNFERIIAKLQKKDPTLYRNLLHKIQEVIQSSNLEHYKNLKYDLKEFKRVHVGSFVLIFKFDKQNDIILFDDFEHHDKIYS